MHKYIRALCAISFCLFILAAGCKKSSGPVGNGNAAHALSNPYYIRALLDTTWVYQGNDNKSECESNGAVCASFLAYGPNSSLLNVKLSLSDSAHYSPKDSVIRSWKGKTFFTRNDITASHAYTFSFEYPDTLGRNMSTEYVINNTGAKLTIDSVVYDGVSHYYFDSITPYKSYRLKGTLSCKLTHLGDSVIHNISQGVYSINVIEAR